MKDFFWDSQSSAKLAQNLFTIHFQSTIYFQLQLTCTSSVPQVYIYLLLSWWIISVTQNMILRRKRNTLKKLKKQMLFVVFFKRKTMVVWPSSWCMMCRWCTTLVVWPKSVSRKCNFLSTEFFPSTTKWQEEQKHTLFYSY